MAAGCAQWPDSPYRNPVLARDFPDPAALRAPDGWAYAYATRSVHEGRSFNIQVARSRDLVRWEHLGDALPVKPRWAAKKHSFWAPHVIHDRQAGRYYMYYSAEPDAGTGKCLAVATSEAPEGPFTDSGSPLVCGEGIEHIDPMAFDDPRTGKRLLYWGSGGQPIRVQELAPERLRFLPGSAPTAVVFPDASRRYHSLVEGAWVTFRRGTYYLFYSGDRCCSRDPRYAVMVARAADPFGPFEALARPVLEGGARWTAPGHNSVLAEDDDTYWMLYHAIDAALVARHPERKGYPRLLLLERLVFRDGWPGLDGAADD
jgi:arabinan endo-1,5-alpha-L-arabinosidase